MDIVRVSAKSGAGIEELRSQILKCVKKQKEMWKTPALPRLPVDRVFSMKGSGTVVTGTLLGGKIHSGDRVMVYPQQTSCRVRGVRCMSRKQKFVKQVTERTELGSDGSKTEQRWEVCVSRKCDRTGRKHESQPLCECKTDTSSSE